MKHYLITINWLLPYPREWQTRLPASNHGIAISRAIREWRKSDGVKGRKIKGIKVASEQI